MLAPKNVQRGAESKDEAFWGVEGVSKFLLAVAIYMGAAGAGLELALWQDYAPLIWPPAGFGLLFLLRGGYRYLPAIAIGALGVKLLEGEAFAGTVFSMLAYTLPPALACWVLRRVLHFEDAMERLRDVAAFILVGVLGTALLSSLINFAWLSQVYPSAVSSFAEFWPILWLSDALGILVITPMLLVWFAQTRINWRNTQSFEVLIWLVLLISLGAMVFRNWAPTDTLRYPLELAMFPLMAWAAVRFGQRGASVGIFISALMAVWELRDVIGPDATRTITQPPGFLWVFVGILATTGMFLAAVFTEIRNRESRIRRDEERMRAFIEAMPDLAFVISGSGHYLEVYAPRRSDFFERAPRLKGRHVSDLFEPETAERFANTIHEVLAAREVRVVQYPMEFAGKLRWFEGRVAPMRPTEDEQDAVIWVAYDVTDSQLATEELRYRDQVLQTLTRAESNLLRVKTHSAGVRSTLEIIGMGMGLDRIGIFSNRSTGGSDKADQACLVFDWARDSFFQGWTRETAPGVFFSDLPDWFDHLGRGRTLMLEANKIPRVFEGFCGPSGVHNVLVLPIFSNERFWGFLAVAQCGPGLEWKRNAVTALASLAGSLGGYLETKRIEDALVKARDEANFANQAKSEFLAMVSHEIRTPMNAIIGFSDLLAQTSLSPDQQEYLRIVTRSGRDLLELINNILDFSKIESAPLELEHTPFRAETTIMEVLETALIKAREKGIELDCEIDDPSDGHYLGDPLRFRQILMNLVVNAVKFTNVGKVTVRMRARPLNERISQIQICVEDTGIGIAEDKVGTLFQAFRQVDSSTTREFGGTGLGLTIALRLAENMGGGIKVQSELGKGSTFTVDLLLEKAAVGLSGKSNAEGESVFDHGFASRYPLRILLAEDDALNTRLALEVLEHLGYEAVHVADGLQALEAVRKDPFDLIIMDVQMQGVDGLEVTRRIRSGDTGDVNRDVYILALTALAMTEDRERCLKAGASEYLSKPIALLALKRILKEAARLVRPLLD